MRPVEFSDRAASRGSDVCFCSDALYPLIVSFGRTTALSGLSRYRDGWNGTAELTRRRRASGKLVDSGRNIRQPYHVLADAFAGREAERRGPAKNGVPLPSTTERKECLSSSTRPVASNRTADGPSSHRRPSREYGKVRKVRREIGKCGRNRTCEYYSMPIPRRCEAI